MLRQILNCKNIEKVYDRVVQLVKVASLKAVMTAAVGSW